MSPTETDPEYRTWFPPEPRGRVVQWLLLMLGVGTLLTNAYYLRFLEPFVTRKSLALVLIGLTAAWMAIRRYGLPSSRSALRAWCHRHASMVALGVILLAAFSLRLWGVGYGLPQSYIPDEYDYVHSYLVMIKRGDLNPHWWYHPSLQPYINVITYLVVFFLQVPSGRWYSVHQLTVEDMLYWGRFGVGVLSGTATVLVTFLLARKLFGTRVGLMAAALIAVFPGAVEVSQYNKPDPLLTLMAALSVLVTLIYLDRGGWRLAFACGVVFGLTVGAKYNGALVVVPFALAVALRHGRRSVLQPDLYLGAAGSVVGFAIACPYFLAELPRFIDQVADGLYTYGFTGREGAQGVNNWANHARYTYAYGAGPWALVAGMAGLALMLYRLDGPAAVFLTFPVLYYAFYSSQKMLFPGNLIPVYPFLAVTAAHAAEKTAKAVGGRARRARDKLPFASSLEALSLGAVLLLLLWYPFAMTCRHNRVFTLPDTGNLARTWIEGHFPPGTHFALERHTPVLDPKRYQITRESRVINQAVAHYREAGVQYLIVSETVYKRFGPHHRQTKAYGKLFKICQLIKEFKPVDGQIAGPTIRILRIPAD